MASNLLLANNVTQVPTFVDTSRHTCVWEDYCENVCYTVRALLIEPPVHIEGGDATRTHNHAITIGVSVTIATQTTLGVHLTLWRWREAIKYEYRAQPSKIGASERI